MEDTVIDDLLPVADLFRIRQRRHHNRLQRIHQKRIFLLQIFDFFAFIHQPFGRIQKDRFQAEILYDTYGIVIGRTVCFFSVFV